MIAKINELKRSTSLQNVKALCETTIAAMSSAIYNGVTNEARFEIEKAATENLFEGLSTYTQDKVVKEWLNKEKRLYSIKNLGIKNAINKLKESEGKYDDTLNAILEQYEEKTKQYPEVLLYEEFVSALSGDYNFVPAVTTQLSAIKNRVNQYKNDIDISKIIETMRITRSNYLLPLIEDVVNDYLTNKTEQSKSLLKETLVKFSYDPYVQDLINAITLDSTNLQLEYANGNVEIDNVYSPIMYLGEHEVAFNIKGSFYVKKGNNINKLKKSDVNKLDKNFLKLCEAVNVPNVEIRKNDITVYVKKDKAVINEDSVTINGSKMNEQDFKNAAEVSQWAGNTDFYMLTEELRQNFNEITEINFAKRVYLKENEGYAADILRLRDNIFITTYDPKNNKSTFYRNINPIQADKIMSEHMSFDVSKTFSDILPNKNKILNLISETKQSYSDYINNLKNRINEFESTYDNSKVSKEILDALNEELSEVKNEYKDYMNETERYINIAEGISINLNVNGKEYNIPIPEETPAAKGENNTTAVTTGDASGTVVGAENINDQPASAITFDTGNSELLGSSPSIDSDSVDLGVDNVEAAADAAEAKNKNKDDEDSDEDSDDENKKDSDEDKLGLEDNEKDSDDKEDDEEEDEDKISSTLSGKSKSKSKSKKDENKFQTYKKEKDLSEDDDEIEIEKIKAEKKPRKKARVFLKKGVKINESKNLKKKKNRSLNESIEVGDNVKFNGKRGSVISQTMDGDLIVQSEGRTIKINPKKVVSTDKKRQTTVKPPYTFDKLTLQNLTTKSLFEQYVKCGIYMNNVPIKLNECFVKFNEWYESNNDQLIGVMNEGKTIIFPKENIRILEDVNDFANPDNYVDGVIIDEETGDALENIKVNVIDYTKANGDTDEVRIVKNIDGQPVVSSAPIAIIKTLSV